jgi:hypothetical protein
MSSPTFASASRFLAISALLAIASGCPGDDDDNPSQPDAGGQTDPDATVVPKLRNPVDLSDDQLAPQAFKLLGDSDKGGFCGDCHSPGQNLLRRWHAVGQSALNACLTDLEVKSQASAKAMLDCLRLNPKDPTSAFQAARLGPFASAAHLEWFEYVFEVAYGETANAEFEVFKTRVSMPKGSHAPFTQAEFDIVAEWFDRGLPKLEELAPSDPPPEGCTPAITPAVASHVNAMKTEGWGAVNKSNALLMHGCQGADDPRKCLTAYPRASSKSYGEGWETLPGTTLRVLFETNDRSSFWTRSSADGRFVASGRQPQSKEGPWAAFIDLQEQRVIGADALYDPGFFPDNSALMFQTGEAAAVCAQSVLTDSPDHITFDEPECRKNTAIGLYQHVGAALGGGDYWTVHSEFVSDDGYDPFLETYTDPQAPFESSAEHNFTPMINTGSGFEPGDTETKVLGFEGDTVISPSARLIVTRAAGPEAKQSGFVLRKLEATPDGAGGYEVATPEIARYCQKGGKPGFSFDERWMVIHHYVEADDAEELGFASKNDPEFQAMLNQGSANIYLVDLLNGSRTRITTMHAGQLALFPHFRSDGWIYFIVRPTGEAFAGEYVVASDAALVLGAP